MSMAPGTVAGERVVNAFLPQKTLMVMQTPTQYGLQRHLRMAGGLGMGIVAAPEVEDSLRVILITTTISMAYLWDLLM